MGRSILSQLDKKSASSGVCGVQVGSLVDPFSFVGVVVDILFLVGGTSGWSVPAAVVTVVVGEGNWRHWTKYGLVGVGSVFDSFCFPFFVACLWEVKVQML